MKHSSALESTIELAPIDRMDLSPFGSSSFCFFFSTLFFQDRVTIFKYPEGYVYTPIRVYDAFLSEAFFYLSVYMCIYTYL